jgi:hypothetical protein
VIRRVAAEFQDQPTIPSYFLEYEPVESPRPRYTYAHGRRAFSVGAPRLGMG